MLKFAMAQDLLTKNPCDFCHPPKIQRKRVNALNREERTRMLELAAVERMEESFDEDDSCYDVENPYGLVEPQGITLTFTVEQLEAMLAEARRREAS